MSVEIGGSETAAQYVPVLASLLTAFFSVDDQSHSPLLIPAWCDDGSTALIGRC